MRNSRYFLLILVSALMLLVGMGSPIDRAGDSRRPETVAAENAPPPPASEAPKAATKTAPQDEVSLESQIRTARAIWLANQELLAELGPSSRAEVLSLNGRLVAVGSKISEVLAKAQEEGISPSAPIVCDDAIFEGRVQKGDTIGRLLENAARGEVNHFITAAARVFSLRAMREGQPYVVVTDPQTGRVKRFEYEINDTRRLIVEGAAKPKARLEAIDYDMRLEVVEAVINDNLFQSVADIGENPQLAYRLVNLFGSEINFIRDLQPGDSFAALVEKRYRDGEYKGYGRILAAHFTNRGKKREAYLFMDSAGRPTYYNGKGENLKKTLLQSPLAVTRLTSRFTNSRKHPILGYSRPHLGVDYGAPTGTPVKAVGEGVVTKRGWGGGYGNQIIIKHSSGLESLYAHLSGYARGLREGQKVSQGQVIGFVGSTGLSTGPHLDFRLRQNGNFIDPTKAINPRGLPVNNKMLDSFKKARDLELACLLGQKQMENYRVDSIVPLPVNLNPEKLEKAAAKFSRRKSARVSQKTGRRALGKNQKMALQAKRRPGKRKRR